jgi:peptidoglycan/LPS O-acetylase OafA/YrhL
MTAKEIERRLLGRDNAFGFMRLMFASFVIFSHTPTIYDGDYQNELLKNVFGAVTFGEIAVDGFFIISGFLITASFVNSRSLLDFLTKRVARIYPAFIICSALCVFLVAPAGGASLDAFNASTIAKSFFLMVTLQPPVVDGAFAGTDYAALNGSMWTIAYEFRCYLLVPLLAALGLLKLRTATLAATLALIAIVVAQPLGVYRLIDALPLHPGLWFGIAAETFRLTAMFLAGTCFYLYRDHLRSSPALLVGAAVILAGCLFLENMSNAAIPLCGGYLIFALAAHGSDGLNQVNTRNDVSYGVYLYAWPITKVVLWYAPDISLFWAVVLTLIGSYAMGWASWVGVERPVMNWVKSRRAVGAPSPALAA